MRFTNKVNILKVSDLLEQPVTSQNFNVVNNLGDACKPNLFMTCLHTCYKMCDFYACR